MLVFAFQSEIWIVQNFNFTVFEDFCLSLSWKYRFLQNVNHAKVQSKTNKYCKFHFDLTRRRLSKSRFKKLGMVPKKLYRNTLRPLVGERLGRRGKLPPKVGRREKLAEKVGRREIYPPVPSPSILGGLFHNGTVPSFQQRVGNV